MNDIFLNFFLLNYSTICSINFLNYLGQYYQYMNSHGLLFGPFDVWVENILKLWHDFDAVLINSMLTKKVETKYVVDFCINNNNNDSTIQQEPTCAKFNTNKFKNLYALPIYIFIKKYYLGFFLTHVVIVYVLIQILAVTNLINTVGLKDTYIIFLYLKGTLFVLACVIFFKLFDLLYTHAYFFTLINLEHFTFGYIYLNYSDYYLNFIYIFIFSLYFLYLYNQLVLKVLNNLVWDLNAELILLLNIATFLNLKLIACGNLFYFLILIESLTLLLIIVCVTMGFLKEDMKSAEESGFKLYINNAVSSGFLLSGISLIYGLTGLTDLQDIAFFFTNLLNLYFSSNFVINAKEFILIIGFIFFLVGIFTKLMQSPFHLWAKDIYEGSSFYFTTYLATISKVGILLFFINFIFVFHKCIILLKFCIFIGLLSTLIGILGALKQKKFKSFIAYSSIAAIGPLLVICGSSLFLREPTILIYLILPYVLSYIGILLLLLLIVSRLGKNYLDTFKLTTIKDIAAAEIQGERRGFKFVQITELSELSGLWFRHKLYAICILILLLTLIAIPPFFNFLLKTYLVVFLATTHNLVIAFIFLLYGVMGCLYYLKLIKLIIFDKPNNHVHILKSTFDLNYVLIVLLTFLILGFIYPKIISLLLFYLN